MKMIKTVLLSLVAMLAVLLEGQAQTIYTNNMFSNTAPNMPFYSISNFYSLNGGLVLFGDVVSNSVNYYTNVGYLTNTAYNTNYATGAQVPYLGAAKSLNVTFAFGGQIVNSNALQGTNYGMTCQIDESTGLGDWQPLVTLCLQSKAAAYCGVMSTNTGTTNGAMAYVSTNLNVGGYMLFRINNIAFTNNGSAVLTATNLMVSYSAKTGL
jgi:hypothetical protein